jgi:protein-tyrosine phosphatase
MADFSFVTRRLATGAAISGPDDVQALLAAGITHCIDCRGEFDDSSLLATSGMGYLWNGTADDGQPKPPAWFAASLAFALPALVIPRAKIYAHCAAGVNRGPSTAYAILRALGLDPAGAEAMIRAARPQVGLAYKNDADAAVTALGYT